VRFLIAFPAIPEFREGFCAKRIELAERIALGVLVMICAVYVLNGISLALDRIVVAGTV
jgi:hypothetical protein